MCRVLWNPALSRVGEPGHLVRRRSYELDPEPDGTTNIDGPPNYVISRPSIQLAACKPSKSKFLGRLCRRA
jgi:hypothetical protein